MSENSWVCSKCARPYGTEGEAVACYNSHPKAMKAESLTKTFKMRFLGGKGAPAQMNMLPLVRGEVHSLPRRYAKFKWWEPVEEIPGFVAPKPGPENSVFPPVTATSSAEAAEAERQFRSEVGSEIPGSTKFLGPGVEEAKEEDLAEKTPEPTKLTRAILNRWNKQSLVNFIKAQGGVADESTLKAQLVDLAFELASKSS